jgi:hypothetical protein
MDSPVLCWWGEEVRIVDPSDVCHAQVLASPRDPVPEIIRAAADRCRDAGFLRIVYQPDSLEVHEVGLAGLSLRPGRTGGSERKRLRPILAREFPALAEPGTAWCLAPGGAGGGVLYLERNSPLPGIVEALARNGLRTEGAWPLPALAECGPAAGGSLLVAAAADRSIVACVSAAGDRSADLHVRGDTLEAAAASLRNALARFDEAERPPGWLALDEGPAAAALRSAAAGIGLKEISVAGLLGRARLLPPGGWPDLLPANPWWRQSRARPPLIAAAIAVLLLGSALSARVAAARKDARLHLRREEEAARIQVQAEAGERKTRAERLRTLDTASVELKAARPALGDFLLALAASVPKSAVLDELALDEGRITVRGRICDRSVRPGDAAAKLCADLAPSGAAWVLRPGPLPSGGSDFVLKGSFEPRPAAPEPPAAAPGDTRESLARGEAGFAAACARLPSAGSFGECLDSLGRKGWTAVGFTADRRSGYELRHASLRYANPRLSDWPQIVSSIGILCDEPGLTIDRFFLTAAPDGAAVFVRAELALTARLKP